MSSEMKNCFLENIKKHNKLVAGMTKIRKEECRHGVSGTVGLVEMNPAA